MNISIIIPLLNEQESLPELHKWIKKVMDENQYTYEVLLSTTEVPTNPGTSLKGCVKKIPT